VLPVSASALVVLGVARRLDRAARGLRDVRFARPLVPPARVRLTATADDAGAVTCTAVIEQQDGPEVVAVRGEVVTDDRQRADN
jgi:acyl dehydratase